MGFLNGIACFSSRRATACSKESNSKNHEWEFMHISLKVTSKAKGLWLCDLNKIMACGDVRSWGVDENGKVNISGYFTRTQLLENLARFCENFEVEHINIQGEKWANHLFRKKEAEEAASTNNANPPSNNTNTTVGYHQPQGYGRYYGDVVLSDNGGYANTSFYGNGGYNGNSYNYQPEPALYQKDIGYYPSESSRHHNGKAVTPDKTVPKPADSPKKNQYQVAIISNSAA